MVRGTLPTAPEGTVSRQSASVTIDRSPDVVFAYLDDVTREREWQPNLRSALQEPPGPTSVGTLKRYVSTFLGRDVENTYRVVELEPGRRVVCRTEPGSTIQAETEVLCESEGSGTRVTMFISGTPRGVLRFIPKRVLEAAYTEELESALRRLKAVLEAADA